MKGIRLVLHRFLPVLLLCHTGCLQNYFYQPDHVLYDTPARAGLAYENVVFPSTDGTRLTGWFIPVAGGDPRKAKGTVIQYHGNAQNMTAHFRFVEWLPQCGFNLFVFDYRGYGASEGRPDPQGVFHDSNSALDHVRSRPDVDPERLLILGQSLGGTNAIAVVGAGNRRGVKAVAVEATFFTYSSIAHEKVFGSGLFMSDTYSAARHIPALAPIPFLLLHGTADKVVPYAHSQRLFAEAGEPKRLITIADGEHIRAFTAIYGDTYRKILVEFFEAALSNNSGT